MSAMQPSRPLILASTLCRLCQRTQRIFHRSLSSTAPFSAARRPAWLANASGQSHDDLSQGKSRWAQTPKAMRAPHKTRPKGDNDEFPCNEDPRLLDDMYSKVLGNEGAQMLPDEVKWLAVTHKSFDHGRRGFNERLAFLGRRIVELQTSLALLSAPQKRIKQPEGVDSFGRTPFQHQSLSNVESITVYKKEVVLERKRLAQLARRYGLDQVVRWKPRQVSDLRASGLDTVLRDTLFAIVGAVSLQKGGEVANQTVRQRVLNPLGL